MPDQFFASPVASTIFVITILTSIRAFSDADLRYKFTFNPYRMVREKQYQMVITHGLIHGGWMHLIFNMVAFYFFAFPLETIIGHWQFTVLYMLSLIAGTIPGTVRHRDDSWYNAVGASGAISAVVLSVILFVPEVGISLIFLPAIPGWIFALLFIAFSFYASFRKIGNIAHDAHLFGAIAGIVITVILRPDVATSFMQWMSVKFG